MTDAPRRSPWYNREYRREKRLAMINSTKLVLIRAGLAAARIVGAALGEPIVSIVEHRYTPDYNVDIVTYKLPDGKMYAVISYQTTRKVITPRDFNVMWRRMQSARNRFVPPDADVTYSIIIDEDTRVTIGALILAKMHRVIIHRVGTNTLHEALKRYIARRLEGFYEKVRGVERVSVRKAAVFAALATIYNYLVGRVMELAELIHVGDRIRDGVPISELWRMLLPGVGPPLLLT